MIDALAQLDLTGWAGQFGVVLLRTLGLCTFVPVFSSQVLPLRVRMMLAVMLAFVMLPFAPRLDPLPAGVADWTVVGLRELAAGFAFGIAARVLLGAVQTAAQLVAGQSGFTLAQMVDPASGDNSAAPGLFLGMVTTALFLSANLHYMFIRAIVASYDILPPAIAWPSMAGVDRMVGELGLRLFTVAVELAAPALIVTIAVDLIMVLVGKAMPQIPILIVAYPLKMAAGLIAIALLCVAVGNAVDWIGRTMATDGARLAAVFAGTGR